MKRQNGVARTRTPHFYADASEVSQPHAKIYDYLTNLPLKDDESESKTHKISG